LQITVTTTTGLILNVSKFSHISRPCLTCCTGFSMAAVKLCLIVHSCQPVPASVISYLVPHWASCLTISYGPF